MAIRDRIRKPYIVDNDEEVFIGIDFPFRKSDGREGWFASTSTTIEATKNNIRNLLSTNQGERLMQPSLGINLRKYLFNPLTPETILEMQDNILDVFEFWLPFVEVRDIKINTADTEPDVNQNELSLEILFNILQDPTTLESVQISLVDDTQQQSTSTIGTY